MDWQNVTRLRICDFRFYACLLSVTPAVASAQWIEMKQPHYSVFYQAGFDADARLVRQWADSTEQVMKAKYGVVPVHYRMSIYLHPAPSPQADVNTAYNHCCNRRDGDSVSTGTIDMLAPSAPAFRSTGAISSLGLRKSSLDYSAKIFVSEYIPIAHYEVQRARSTGGWKYYDAPNWFVQGLQEYDAIFHSTPANRDSTAHRLSEWATAHRGVFECCSPELSIKDDYNGGATFVAFLAAQFGESIHVRLLQSSAPTFFEALTIETRPCSRQQLFALFENWLERGAHSRGAAPLDRHDCLPAARRATQNASLGSSSATCKCRDSTERARDRGRGEFHR